MIYSFAPCLTKLLPPQVNFPRAVVIHSFAFGRVIPRKRNRQRRPLPTRSNPRQRSICVPQRLHQQFAQKRQRSHSSIEPKSNTAGKPQTLLVLIPLRYSLAILESN